MTVLTVPVEGDFEFLDLPLVFRRAMAFAALLNRLGFIPNVFTVFIDVVAFLAFQLIILGVTEMWKADGTFAISLVSLIFDRDILRHVVGTERPNHQGDYGATKKKYYQLRKEPSHPRTSYP
jgi:hypothetical protein